MTSINGDFYVIPWCGGTIPCTNTSSTPAQYITTLSNTQGTFFTSPVGGHGMDMTPYSAGTDGTQSLSFYRASGQMAGGSTTYTWNTISTNTSDGTECLGSTTPLTSTGVPEFDNYSCYSPDQPLFMFDGCAHGRGNILRSASKKPSENQYLCYNTPKGFHWDQWGGGTNAPDCFWITDNQASQCCSGTPPTPTANCDGTTPAQVWDCGAWTTDSTSCANFMPTWCANSGWGSPACSNYAIKVPSSQVNAVIDTYTSAHPYSPNDAFYSKALPAMCSSSTANSIACSTSLSGLCANYTVNDLVADPILQKICGCNLPSSQYPMSTQVGIACEPICQSNAAISPPQGQICNKSVCVMDDVTVNLVNSSTGDINIGNICGNCGGAATCACWFDNVTIDEINSITGKINITSNCSECYVVPPGGNPESAQPVECSTINNGGSGGGGGGSTPENWWQKIEAWFHTNKTAAIAIAGVLLLLFLIIVVILIVRMKNTPSSVDGDGEEGHEGVPSSSPSSRYS